jgi:hypothetical protein
MSLLPDKETALPHRRQIVELFEAWDVHHGERPVKAAALAEPVRAFLDPQGRGRQHIAARVRAENQILQYW